MNCVICKKGRTVAGLATVTIERGPVMLVVRRVPADVCEVCGEEYVAEEQARTLLEAVERAASEGVQFEVREFAA